MLLIMGTFAAGLFALAFGRPIAFRIDSGSGMPGVGVAPFLTPFFNSSGLGIPGVGVVPFGNGWPLVGMPGMGLPLMGSGLPDNPGGIFAGSNTVVFTPMLPELAVFAPFSPQPNASSEPATKKEPKICLIIK